MTKPSITILTKKPGCWTSHKITMYTANQCPDTGALDNQPRRVPSGTRIEEFISRKPEQMLAKIRLGEEWVYGWLARKDWTSSYEVPTRAYRSPEVSLRDYSTEDLIPAA